MTTPADFARRRARVCERLGDDVLVVGAGEAPVRSRDTHHRFRAGSDFYYLTGLAEPQGVLVLRGNGARAVLFVRPKDREAEIWTGRRPGVSGAAERTGIDDVREVGRLDESLPELLDGARRVHVDLSPGAPLLDAVLRACATLRRNARSGARPPQSLGHADDLMGWERIRKDAAALGCLKRAVEITLEGHRAAVAAMAPGAFEYQVEAALEAAFRRLGAAGPGYGSIVAAGPNATILHYVANDAPIVDGSLLLLDAGAEYDGFSADLTRTYPVSGRFSPAQRDLYECVLRANQAGIDAVAPGRTLEEIHDRVVRTLVEGFVDLGLCRGSVEEAIETGAYRRYYMHRTSHWLGADVHDLGPYTDRDGSPVPLAPDYVLTVEPGCYVAEDDEDAPAELRGVGIRIEDDVRVTPEGAEVLTAASPKDPAKLEAWIARVREEAGTPVPAP